MRLIGSEEDCPRNIGVLWGRIARRRAPIKADVSYQRERRIMLMARDLRTVCEAGGLPVLEIVKEDGEITIFEADDMDQRIKFPAAVIPALIAYLESLK